MIKVKHPDPTRNRAQAEFLGNCQTGDRRFHELMFCYGNSVCRYYRQADGHEATEKDFEEWVNGLLETIGLAVRKEGFDGARTSIPFKRYVLEKNDVGLKAYVVEIMGKDEYAEYEGICLHKQ